MTAHDWAKLDNGWARVGDALRKDIGCDTQFYSFDDGSSFFHGGELCGSPDTNLSLLTQACAQRKQCEVHELTAFGRAEAHLAGGLDLDRWRIVRSENELSVEPMAIGYFTRIRVKPGGLGGYLNQDALDDATVNDFCSALKVCLAARRILAEAK